MYNWLYDLLISELQMYSEHLHLIMMLKIKPILFSPLATLERNVMSTSIVKSETSGDVVF